MQGRVLEKGHLCKTPNLDRLAAQGVRFCKSLHAQPNLFSGPRQFDDRPFASQPWSIDGDAHHG